jgi:2-polyprenyl-6-methoxyphenol hydroxylase-like FAD-dependent oxidoreductase
MTGLALARLLSGLAEPPVVLDRGDGSAPPPRPYAVSFHGFPALERAGVIDEVRARAWPVAPGPEGRPVAYAIGFGTALGILGAGIRVRRRTTVTGLLRDGAGRVVGVRTGGPEGARELPADLVVAADGAGSPVRDMAGIPVEVTPDPEIAHLSFTSPVVPDRSFALTWLSDGRQVGMFGWPEGSAGWWDVSRVGREAALAPGLPAFRAAFARLLPEAAPALQGVTSPDQLTYREPAEVRSPCWWVPGAVAIGDAAHVLGPETGIGSGMALGDALALAGSLGRHPDDPDAACADYERWRRPAVAPYEALGAAGGRMAPGGAPGERRPHERWPPG